jgi:23S rRNA (guanine745-N1)-methyltransferase
VTGPWRCPVCHANLQLNPDGPRWSCEHDHSFDVARQGYVNLLIAGQRRSRNPGDSREMIDARRRFLASGAYDRLSDLLAWVCGRAAAALDVPARLLDVGCGEGHHTRRVASAMGDAVIAGIDVAKPAVAIAARSHPSARYAVATAADLPLGEGSVDIVLDVFGPVVPAEVARVLHPGGIAVIAHPGEEHLMALRRLVYDDPRPHDVKDPLRGAGEWFDRVGSDRATFPVPVDDDLFAMTPYRWHAPPDIGERLAAGPTSTTADILVTTYRRR